MEPIVYFYESVNRSTITVKSKQPFLDWMNALDPENPVAGPIDATTFLVKQKETDPDVEKWLKINFDKLFINELNDWWTDEDDWPKKRNYKLFTEWFDVEVASRVLDIETTPLRR